MAFMHHLKKKIVSDKGMTACRGQRMQAACTGYIYPGGEPTCGCQVHEAGIFAALGHQRERMHAALPSCTRWRASRWLWCWVGRVLGGRRCRRSRCCRRSQRCRRSRRCRRCRRARRSRRCRWGLGVHAVSERPGDGSVQAIVFMPLAPSPRNHDQLCEMQSDYECEQSVEHPPGLHRAVNQVA